MAEPVDSELRVLLDEAAINRLLKRYARALDERDFAVLDTIFTPDAHVDFSSAGGPAGPFPGVRDWLAQVLTPIPELQHFTTNIEIALDGDTASGKSYTLAISGMTRDDGTLGHMILGAQYIDAYVRTAEGWRISSRREAGVTAFGDRLGPPDAGS